MSLRTKLRIPREHGAWAMLYVPFLLGAIIAGAFSLKLILLLIAASSIFISRESLLMWWRARNRGRAANNAGRTLLIYWSIAFISGLPLLFYYRLWLLIPLAGVGILLLLLNGRQALELEDRSIRGEILAICAMTLTAPAAYYAGSGNWDQTIYWLWGLNVLFFSSSVFYIKYRILNLNPRKKEERKQIALACLLYHSFLLVGLVALVLTQSLSLLIMFAFTPVLIRSFLELLTPSNQVNLKQAGLLEMTWSVLFLIFVTFHFRQF